jgi:hypothetical protein
MPKEIKKEPVEEYDGTYVCFICSESVPVEEWSVKSTSSAALIDTIDLTSGSEGVGRRKDEEDAKECDTRNDLACEHS